MSSEKIDNYFTWRIGWCHPFESPWGIFEKFKFANNATARDIFDSLGNEQVKQNKRKVYGHIHRDLIQFQGLDENLLKNVFGHNIKLKNKNMIDQFFDVLPKEHQSPKKNMRSTVAFCPICVRKGFHSFFHQVKMLKHCPFHNVSLEFSCPVCQTKMPYEISDVGRTSAFVCTCGHWYIDRLNLMNTFRDWEDTQGTYLILKELMEWLELNPPQIKKLQNLHYNSEIVENHWDKLLPLLINVLTAPVDKDRSSQRIVRLPPYVNKLKTNLEYPISANRRNRYSSSNLYKESESVYSSIARHLRKTILKDHKTCIQRFVKRAITPDICPYAYAYVMWRKVIEGLDYARDVHQKVVMTPRRMYPHSLDVITRYDVNYLRDVFYERNGGSFQYKQPESIVPSKWLLFHIMAHLMIYDFKGWLTEASRMIHHPGMTEYQPFGHKYVPLYVVEYPLTDKESYNFIWIVSKEEMVWPKPLCPFTTKRKRRDYRYAQIKYIEHPIVASMKNFSYW